MKVFRRARPLLGTFVEISVWNDCEKRAHNAISHAFAEIELVQSLLSIHSATSEVSKINQLKKDHILEIHALTYQVLKIARSLFVASDRLFDIVRLEKGSPPVTMESIDFLDGQNISINRELKIDLGGIGKGFAVDKAVQRLKAEEIQDGVVCAGGDLRVFGERKQIVFLRNPKEPEKHSHSLELHDRALATSANYFRDEGSGGDLDCGIRNPQTGKVWRSDQSISVAAPTCAQADALTKVVALQGKRAKAVLISNAADAFVYDGISCNSL